jgi:hypothetical protein
MNKRVYKGNIVHLLRHLSDRNYQENVWLSRNNPEGLVDCFVEAANMLFDDCVVVDYLMDGEILFDRATTDAFHALHAAVAAVNEYRSQEEIINDPLMEVIRQKAAEVLALIEASDGKESTVEIIE